MKWEVVRQLEIATAQDRTNWDLSLESVLLGIRPSPFRRFGRVSPYEVLLRFNSMESDVPFHSGILEPEVIERCVVALRDYPRSSGRESRKLCWSIVRTRLVTITLTGLTQKCW